MRRRPQRGMTLVEMLVATAITLLLVYGMAAAFATISVTVAANRATVEMAGQIRAVSLQLQQDLEGVTLPVRPGIAGSSGQGYFEYREGPERDYVTAAGAARPADSHIGDYDDVLMLTTRNTEQPFRGRVQSQHLGDLAPRSTVAEVIWWLRLEDADGDGLWTTGERFTLHRRALLILPELNNAPATRNATNPLPLLPFATWQTALDQFVNDNDLSVRVVPITGSGMQVVANSLADLSNRANRFAHLPEVRPGNYPPGGFPWKMDLTHGLLSTTYALDGTRVGEDVVLYDCVAFDLKGYDPLVAVQEDSAGLDALAPGDPGFDLAGNTAVGAGAFVDLNYANTRGLSLFSGPPELRSGLSGLSGIGKLSGRPYTQVTDQIVYDTWSGDYEQDGVNQDTVPPPGPPSPMALFPEEWFDNLVDEGMDGIDNLEWRFPPPAGVQVYQHGTDDVGERETSPPYPVPLRGLQATLRMYELDSRQVRQVTVVSDFTPE